MIQKALLTKTLLCTCLFLLGLHSFSRAQQCTSFGDPVVNITFGSGSNPGPSLSAATTSYSYFNAACPGDGYYALTNATSGCFQSTWHSILNDHTGNRNGYFMLINASFNPGDFYLDTVRGLCANTTYQFAAWIANVLVPSACGGGGIQPNITFKIESTTGGTPLAMFNTGDISTSGSPTWQQYGLVFTTPTGVTDIVLRMTNNAPGGCGNDLALDDITFRPCGPNVVAGIAGNTGSDTVSYCVDAQSPLTFNGAISVGYNAPSYQWQVSKDTGATWTDIPNETGTTYIRPVNPAAGFYQYRLVVGEGGNVVLPSCRVSSNRITVRVSPKPIPLASNNGPICQGDTLILKATDGVGFDWTGPGGYAATGQPDTLVNSTPAQSGQYQVKVTSFYGCTQMGFTTVLVYPSPTAQFIAGPPACERRSLTFTDQSSATTGQTIIGWKWYFGDGDSTTVQTPTHVYDTTGDYPAGLIVTTDKGCRNLQTKVNTITIHYLPKPDFSLPQICLADPQALFNDSSTIADGTASQFTYQWDFGEPASGAANTSTQKNANHKYLAAGPYSVTLKLTSGAGCVKDTVKTFTVNGNNPVPAYTIANAALLCSNQPVILTDASSVTPGSIIRIEAFWDYQNDPAIQTIDDTPAAGKKYDHTYPDFSSPANKTFRIRYIAYSGQTCLNEKDETITVLASPKTQFDALSNVCEQIRPFHLTGGSEITGFAGAGAYSGPGVSSLGFFNPRLAGPGLDTLHYIFTGDNGCSSQSDQTILVYPQPHADAGPALYILQGEAGVLEGSGSGDKIQFSWSPPDSILGDPTKPTPQVAPQNDLVYTLTVTSEKGCVDSSSVKVFVLKLPVVPNAFSPNGDGINDTWVIRYLNEYPSADIEVFNRYGQPVYHTAGYTTPWDGTYKGQPLPVGTYYWIIRPGNGRKQISGSVTILR